MNSILWCVKTSLKLNTSCMSYVLKFEHLMVMYMYKFQIISWTLDLKDIIKFLLLFQNFTIKTLRYFFFPEKEKKIFFYLCFSNNLRTWEEERDGAGKLGGDAIIRINETWKSTNLIHSFNSVSVILSMCYPYQYYRKSIIPCWT